METVTFRNADMGWDIAADLHFPPDFEPSRAYPAILSAHPIGSCKEQTSGNVYAAALAVLHPGRRVRKLLIFAGDGAVVEVA